MQRRRLDWRSRTPFRSCMGDRCSLLLALSVSAHPPTPFLLVLECYRCVLPVRFAARRGGSGTSGLCIRSLLHPGQPQLNGEARRPPQGMGRLSASSCSSTTICCTGWFAGTGFSRVTGHRHLFALLCPWSFGGRGEVALLARCLPHGARRRQSLSLSLHAYSVTVIGAAGHNRWGVVERSSL